MRIHTLKATLNATLLVAALFLFGAAATFGQQVINLTATPTAVTTPDGSAVPMWGYFCGAAVTTNLAGTSCGPLNPLSAATATAAATWSPVVITVPAGQYLTINLTNSLSFTPTGATTANLVPTSLTIVGQLGGGLGSVSSTCNPKAPTVAAPTGETCTPSPVHSSQVVTWSTVGTTPAFTPPAQGPRVQSFGTEVAAGTTAALTFGSATYPLRPGTYLIESGTHPSIQGPMGLYGVLVVTCPPTATAGCLSGTTTIPAGTAYPLNMNGGVTNAAVSYNAELPLVFSEIDPVQNKAVSAAVNTAGFSETMVWSGQPGSCGNPSSTTYHQCYPPAVNYTPLYYMINGVAFSKNNASASLFQSVPSTGVTASGGTTAAGLVLLRLVNAGLRMHVPSILGSQITGPNGTGALATVNGFQLIAEDGNPLPATTPRVQNEIFLAAGKVMDVMINAPLATASALPIYDRELSLSSNGTAHDSGMLAYIGVNGSTISTATTAAFASAVANPDTYNAVVACAAAPCTPLNVYDPGKGVIANDINVYGVSVLTPPATGTLVLNVNGTFVYTPPVGFSATSAAVTFTYCANGTVTGFGTTAASCSGPSATVSLGPEATANLGTITAQNRVYKANTAAFFTLKSPGVLGTQYDNPATPPSLPVTDSKGYPLSIVTTNAPVATCGGTLVQDAEGGFTLSSPPPSVGASHACTFSYTVKDTEGTTATGSVTVNFPGGSGLQVKVVDNFTKPGSPIVVTDYRWIIEEDRTFYNNPNCTVDTATPAAGCPSQTATSGVPPILGANFHTSYMTYVAQGCTGPKSCEAGQQVINSTGTPVAAVCDVGDGVCRPDTTGSGKTQVLPSSVPLDPSKRYYISVLPGDAADPFYGAGSLGHGMGGAAIPALCTPAAGATTCTITTAAPYTTAPVVTVFSEPSPYPPAKLSVFVFQDDFPLNGEHDSGGGTGAVNTNNEPGLGQFQIHLWDAMGGSGDFTGQMSYDMFNQPLSNSLAGTIDPISGSDACPITNNPRNDGNGNTDPTATGITGMIVTCPEFEADGTTPSPLAGQAVISNLMPGRWGVIATPGADRIARGEEWLQTNTLDGQKAHDAFTKISEPSFFQEYGPASFHVSIGFANPAIINSRHQSVCNGTDSHFGPGQFQGTCVNTITGRIVGERLSRTPDERLYGSGSRDAYAWTQCYVSFGDPDGEDFIFTKCDADGKFTLNKVPTGDWRLTTFDQWNDQLVDGLSTPVRVGSASSLCPGTGSTQTVCNMGDIAATQWQTNIQTVTFIDDNNDGVHQATEAGIPFANVAVRQRDGSLGNFLATDFSGVANFNETFPLFSWYTLETDVTRYKNTGIHVVYDVGGPADGSPSCGVTGYPPCGTSTIAKNLANTAEKVSLPTYLRVPGAVYCANADCTGRYMDTPTGTGPSASDPPSSCTTATTAPFATTCGTILSSGRIDPPSVGVEAWQGFPGQFEFVEFGKKPYAAATATTPAENGGIRGHVEYASTRPFDDPQMLVQVQWTPLVPNVTINLYKEGYAADNVTPTLTLVDTTKTSSWDDWAQGFRKNAAGTAYITGGTGTAAGFIPNMNCPGQGGSTGVIPDLFFYSLQNQPVWLDYYNNVLHGTATTTMAVANNSQFKCYDGMHNWNQVQPAPYDGMYSFPSVTATDPTTGRPTATNCTACIPNPDSTDHFRVGTPMLPSGKYVVEIVMPPGYELVKEEDKNILIGDNFIAPVTQQFGGLGNVFIIPDQASVCAVYCSGFNPLSPAANPYNANNPQNPTQSFGTGVVTDIVPSFVPEPVWPCVGEARIVPQYISLFPQSKQVSPFAGATRNLCDRKEVVLQDQMSVSAKFFIYTATHIASKFEGGITDDYTSEFDPFAPTFGEKFSPPDMPVSIKDWTGQEIGRVYADHWGTYNGMVYSTWEVNPPNPTGYSPNMPVFCMNDPGPILDTRVGSATNGQMITDPLFMQGYSQFCYELPFMPGTTDYLDTPVVPTSAFAGVGYNNVDCAYPDLTPAVSEVDGAGYGPWVGAAGATLTINALGDQYVINNAYAGPNATTAPYNQKTVKRHFGFGTQCTAPSATSATCNTLSSVTIGGASATITSWSDTQIKVTVPATTGTTTTSLVQPCPVQQQTQYSGSTAYCGELIITAGNGKRSVDTVTVTIGGKPPTHVGPSASIQAAIDAAAPGDMLIIDPAITFVPAPNAPGTTNCAGVTVATATCVQATTAANHNEMVIMWKPVRLQGVGAPTSVINATTHPAGKIDTWRQYVTCLFGLGINGSPINTSTNGLPSGLPPATVDVNRIPNQYNPTGVINPATGTAASCPANGWNFFTAFDESGVTAGSSKLNAQVDRLPLEATVGWDANLNGNLAELLQEPALMGALEGAGITVLSKGVNFPTDPYDSTLLAGFPTGTTLLVGTDASGGGNFPVGDANPLCHTSATNTANPFSSNFSCNPSSIDALTITQSSQGGGGIFVHGWGHNLQIANNRIYSNAGTLSGGINLGQGEFAPPYVQGSATNAPPGSCEDSPVFNILLPYCQNINVNIHHNYVALNSSTGDELFSATPAGAGGVSICTGADYYKFNYNWVCGNLSSGDGGGVGHLGFTYNGDIEHNTILFNQSTNPTIPANGGGLVVMGAPDADLVCNGNAAIDTDCAPFNPLHPVPGDVGNTVITAVGPSDGTGPGLVINANLILGNSAESGTGAGIAFNHVNGSDMVAFPTEGTLWNSVTLTNNIIVDNVGGWDGAGISLLDSPMVNIINNTIAYNSSTASAGILFNTLGAPIASQGGSTCQTNCGTLTAAQPAGLVAIQHSAVLAANLPLASQVCAPGQITGCLQATPVNVVCPPGHFQPGTPALNGSCQTMSYPKLENNIFWHNSSFDIKVGALSPAFQQNVVTLVNGLTNTAITSQPRTDSQTGTLGTSSVTITGGTGACVGGTSYWDIGVRGDTSASPNSGSGVTLAPSNSVMTSITGYPAAGNSVNNPNFISQYCNGSRIPPETPGLLAAGWLAPPGISDATVPNPIFNLTPAATVDEGNNWVNLNWGPLSMTNPTVLGTDGNYGGGPQLGNYGILTGSSAIGKVTSATNLADAPTYDFYDKPRTGTIDAGAVQFSGGRGPIAEITVSPSNLDFGPAPDHSPIGLDQDVQIINSDNIPVTFNPGNSFTITGANATSFRIAASGGGTAGANSCLAATGATTLAPGEACVVNVIFVPNTTQGVRTATLTISPTGGLPNQTVSLRGQDTIAGPMTVSAITPALTTTPASTVAHTGTITVTNTIIACFDPLIPGNPAGCNVNAGPYVPTAITPSAQVPSATNFTLGGTCAVGTPIAPGTSCTITITYTPPAAPASPNGSIRLTVTGYGTVSTAPIINNVLYPAN